MNILHLDLKPVGDQYAEFRFFWDNPNDFQSRQVPLAEIAGLIEEAEKSYYTRLPEEYPKTGQALYNWLDGSDRNLQRAISQHQYSGIVLAIAATEKLANLPWEVLHDGKSFLVERRPAIIPIRWVQGNHSKQLTVENQPADRALNVLFMATSPLGVEPELDFEAEEASVLEATRRKPLSLVVEESGCLTELGYLLKDYDQGYFDVLHLTGHASSGEKPYFVTETELGQAEYSSAEDIATELQFQMPKLIFLSGCNTGYSGDAGTVPSMAEALLNQGATAVLGWGQRVLDGNASLTAAALYQELSAGMSLTEAVALTYQDLLNKKTRDWHLLRLYVAGTLPGALVKRGRKPVPPPSVAPKYIDSEGKLRVATRETFVGRRRQLQNCLRTLKTSSEEIGVLIHGMGGLGKSTIAARLCDRLSDHETIVWWRQIDESNLVSKLADKLRNAELRKALREGTQELKYRLRDVFSELNQNNEKPFLLIFDDFEWNLEHRQGKYILKSQVTEVLQTLVWAIKETYTAHRIIITCRYIFESDLLQSFYKQPLESFRKSYLQKKLIRLKAFNSREIDPNLIERSKALADGNPRLLEWLNDEVLLKSDAETKLIQLEDNPQNWKGRIIWEELYEQLDQAIERILSQCLVFEIPVTMQALELVCDSIFDYKKQLSRAIELGLIEVSPETEESNRVYRVSRILPHIIPNIQLPEAPEVYYLSRKAHEILHSLWGNPENQSEEKWREIFRLLFAEKENSDRFRLGFYQMLEVQYNAPSDRAYESELRKVKENLVEDGLYSALENFLNLGKWEEADVETARIFYQVMVKQNYVDWEDTLKNFPCETLKEINRLWLQNSNDRFGISIQMEIYQSLGGSIKYKAEKTTQEWKELEIEELAIAVSKAGLTRQDWLQHDLDVWKKLAIFIGWEKERLLTKAAITRQERHLVKINELFLDHREIVNQANIILERHSERVKATPIFPLFIYAHHSGEGGWGKNRNSYGDGYINPSNNILENLDWSFTHYEGAALFYRAEICNLQGDISRKVTSDKSPLLLGMPVISSQNITDAESNDIKSRIEAKRGTEPVLYDGDSHLITIAPTGAGKGRSVIIPNLLTYEGPIVVFDPKGENYAVTARTRREMGQQVIRLDPFRVIDNDSDCFNPLDIFNLSNADVETDAQMLAELLSKENRGTREPFWDLNACGLISGLIAYTVTSKPDNERHLDAVRQILMAEELDYAIAVKLDTEGEKMNRMAFDELASFIAINREQTRPSVLATARSYIKAFLSERVVNTLIKSSFSLADIVEGKPLSIYIIIPPDKLRSHKALLKLWIGTLLKAITSRKHIPQKSTLFLLDECAQMGYFPFLETAITLCRGYGLQTWTFWQDVSQIQEIYQMSYSTIINNCAVLQIFGAKNYLVSKGFGEIVGANPEAIREIDPTEQVLVIDGGQPIRCSRFDYLRDIQFKGMHDQNPFYSSPSLG